MKLFEVVVSGQIGGQQAIWRSNWVSSGAGADDAISLDLVIALGYDAGSPSAPAALSLLERFQDTAIDLASIQNIFARNVYSDLDLVDIPLGTPWVGTNVSAGQAPTFVSPKLRSSRVRGDVRRGFVSLWGVPETAVDNEDVLNAGQLAIMQDLANDLSGGVIGEAGLGSIVYLNCIAGKERYMVPGTGTDAITNPARWAYRYYEDPEVGLAKLAIDPLWAPVSLVSSQVSRKRGKGA